MYYHYCIVLYSFSYKIVNTQLKKNKRGVAGPNEIQNGGKIRNEASFFTAGSAYNGRNALAKHIYTERSGRTQPPEMRKCCRMLLSPHTLRKTRVPDGSQENG